MLRLPLLFARRYLFSRKSHSVINIISRISSLAVAVPVMAMVILLSVFNGFDGLVRSMYRAFDPDILITPVKGKVFDRDSVAMRNPEQIEGVEILSYVLEENALFEYRGRQYIGIIRGVDEYYSQVVGIDSLIVAGEYRLRFGDFDEACVGQGVAYALGIRTNFNDPIIVYVPRRGKISPLLPYHIYREDALFPASVFALEAEVDGKYVIASLDFTQRLLNYEGKASALAIKLAPGTSPEKVQARIAGLLGDDFRVLTRYQQKESFYRILLYEKWGIYFIVLLVLIVASFSLVGSLAMLIIEKRKDRQTLIRMGAGMGLVRRIFIAEGMLIYSIGGFLGLILGVMVAYAQQVFGFIRISAQTFLIDAYPVEVHLTDVLWVMVTFLAVSLPISYLTVRTMIRDDEIRQG